MSGKTLNKANLEKLGAERLAALVIDLVQGSAALQRRARMELSAAQGPKEVAADIRKRFASLRRSSSFVDWSKQRALVKDLNGLLGMIENSIAPHDADEAFELLSSFLHPSRHRRRPTGRARPLEPNRPSGRLARPDRAGGWIVPLGEERRIMGGT